MSALNYIGVTVRNVQTCSGVGGCPLRGLEKKITLTFQKYVTLDAKNQKNKKTKNKNKQNKTKQNKL